MKIGRIEINWQKKKNPLEKRLNLIEGVLRMYKAETRPLIDTVENTLNTITRLQNENEIRFQKLENQPEKNKSKWQLEIEKSIELLSEIIKKIAK